MFVANIPKDFSVKSEKKKKFPDFVESYKFVDNLYTRTMRDNACSILTPVCESASEATKHTK